MGRPKSCGECSSFKFNEIRPHCSCIKDFTESENMFNLFCLSNKHLTKIFYNCPKKFVAVSKGFKQAAMA
jgi:hypothetical protein